MLTEDQLRTLISLGREQRGVEFKGPGTRDDKPFMAKVVRAMLGLANKRDGGVLVIGVADDGTTLAPIGLSESELATWSYDHVAAVVTNYADPYVTFSIASVPLDGNMFAVIEVEEFDSTPVICKKGYDSILRNGALYVRPHGKVETVECPTHVEMREVVDMATDLHARALLASLSRIRLGENNTGTERDKLDEEAKELL